MRIACLYDIHANLPALEATLDDVRAHGVDHIVFGGDVLAGPMPRQTLDLINSLDIPSSFIVGNGEVAVIDARRGIIDPRIPPMFHAAMTWNAEQLTDADVRTIQSWPVTLKMTVAGLGDVLFFHATPRDLNEVFLKTTAEEKLRPFFDPLHVDLMVCGHTHMQFDRMVGSTRVINAGSVGMSFQGRGAYWALIGPDVELKRTAYDYDAAAARIRATGYPSAEFSINMILKPPTEEATLAQFTPGELKGP